MINIGNYILDQEIDRDQRRIVYKGMERDSRRQVIAFAVSNKVLDAEDISRIALGFEMLSQMQFPGIIKFLSYEKNEDLNIFVCEDFESIFLSKYLHNGETDLKKLLKIAINFTSIVQEIHRHNYIHKNLSPGSILINPTTLKTKISCFEIATQIKKERITPIKPDYIKTNLLYISPEQTGRTNFFIDSRSDLYSLGIIFYEMFTGRLPFNYSDPMEIVHAHIARQPYYAHLINPELPEVISEIIDKLLEKNPDDRYQSCAGLNYDLKKCYDQYWTSNNVFNFKIASQDIPEKFNIPEKTYGRESELSTLQSIFDSVSKGGSSTVFIEGLPGTGKSTIVNELVKQNSEKEFYFASGKFEQYNQNIPYSPFIDACRDLLKQVLTETNENLLTWKKKLIENLQEENIGPLAELIPEIELIIGIPHPETKASVDIEKAVFISSFGNLIKTFSTENKPLILFIDDWQWISSGSINLIRNLINSCNNDYVMLIGSYRANEINSEDSIFEILKYLRESPGIRFTEILLNPLGLQDIISLISDTFKCSMKKAKPLANIIKQRTLGNPLFIKQFMRSLNDDKLIQFNREKLAWEWDNVIINEVEISENIVEVLEKRLKELPVSSMEVLKYASCIGTQFDLNSLAYLHETEPRFLYEQLVIAVNEGFLLKILSVNTSAASFQEDISTPGNLRFRFVHDRVQQVIFNMLSDKEKRSIKYRYAQYLLIYKQNRSSDNIFQIVNQLNENRGRQDKGITKLELAKLNYDAGKKAKLYDAYIPAQKYFAIAKKLLGMNGWQNYNDLMTGITIDYVESAIDSRNLVDAEKMAVSSLRYIKSNVDIIKTYNNIIRARFLQNKYKQALASSLELLKFLGINFSNRTKEHNIKKQLYNIFCKLNEYEINDFLKFNEINEIIETEIQKVLFNASVIASYTDSDIYQRVTLEFLNRMLAGKGWRCSYTPFALVSLAVLMSHDRVHSEKSAKIGKIALELANEYNNPEVLNWVNYFYNINIGICCQPIENLTDNLFNIYRQSYSINDLEFASNCLLTYLTTGFYSGMNLDMLEQKINYYRKDHNINSQKSVTGFIQSLSDMVVKLKYGDSLDSNNKKYDISRRAIDGHNLKFPNKFLAFSNKINLAFTEYSSGNFRRALQYIDKAEEDYDITLPGVLVIIYRYLQTLTITSCWNNYNKKEKERYLPVVENNCEYFRILSQANPAAFSTKYLLITAEWKRIAGETHQAFEYYYSTLKSALNGKNSQETGLCAERAGIFMHETGKDELAAFFFEIALKHYNTWGAISKFNYFGQLFGNIIKSSSISAMIPKLPEVASPDGLNSEFEERVNILAVTKSTQAISGEIILEKLLNLLIKIVMENAGAEKVFLLLNKDGDYYLEAEGTSKVDEIRVMISLPLDYCILPKKIIRYVARTKETVVLNDAANDTFFADDEYIHTRKPRSILCMPVLHHNEIIAVMLLENNFIAGAFTKVRQETLRILSSQVAISLENAFLYNNLKKEIIERKKAEEKLIGYRDQLQELVEIRTAEIRKTNKLLQIEINDKRNTEEELRKSQERFRRQYLSIPIPTYTFERSKDGSTFTLTDFNKLAEEINSGKSHYLLGSVIETLFEDRPDIIEDIHNCFNNKLTFQREVEYKPVFVDTQRFYIFTYAYVPSDLVMLHQEDITERKLYENALQESEATARALINAPTDYIVLYDEKLNILAINNTAAGNLEMDAEDLIGRNLDELFSPHVARIRRVKYGEVFKTGKTLRYEDKGDTGWYDHVIYPVKNEAGEVKKIAVVARDISGSKKTEEELRKAKEDAERANRAKSEFLANMSHEIRTPLNAILGFSEILLTQTTDQQHKSYLSTILSSGNTLLSLINDILDLSKIEADKLDMNYEAVDIEKVVFDIKNIFAHRTEEKHLEFRLNINPNLPKALLFDEVRLRQILFNLIGNSVKFTDKGYVAINVDFKYENANNSTVEIYIGIDDTGIGIPLEDQDTIFESFSRHAAAARRKSGSTGLGLAITKRLTEKMNGSISVHSTLGLGTSFNLLFTKIEVVRSRDDSLRSTALIPDFNSFKPATILLVDDIEYNRKLIIAMLKDTKINVIEASNGDEVIKLLGESKPQLILMDMRMPGRDGTEINNYIRNTLKINNIPIIAFTADAFTDEDFVAKHRFDGLLKKPILKKDLLLLLAKFLQMSKKEPEKDDSKNTNIIDSGAYNTEVGMELKSCQCDNIEGLISVFENELTKEWKENSDLFLIDNIEVFAEKVKELGVENKIEYIINYGKILIDYINNFKVTKIKKTLSEFPGLIEHLKQYKKNS